MTPQKRIVALTGVTGFLGGHVLDTFVAAGWHVRALVRRPHENTDAVTYIHGSLDHISALEALTAQADAVVHCAGLTKALSRSDFFDVNLGGTERLVEAAEKGGDPYFIQISSLAAREPLLSHYGASKAAADLVLSGRKRKLPWTIIRPPAIYGPGDHEILKIIKASRYGVLPAPGSSTNRFSMIHVADLARLIVQLATARRPQGTFEVDDLHPGGYRIEDVAKALDANVKIIPIARPVLEALGSLNELGAKFSRRPVALTRSNARYLSHSDWTVRSARRPSIPDWKPYFKLQQGMAETIKWYRDQGLL